MMPEEEEDGGFFWGGEREGFVAMYKGIKELRPSLAFAKK